LVKNVYSAGCFLDMGYTKQNVTLTEEKLDETGARL